MIRLLMTCLALFAALSVTAPVTVAQGQLPACKARWQGFGENRAIMIMRMSVKPREECIYSIRIRQDMTLHNARVHTKPKSGRIVRLKRNHFVYAAPAGGTDQFAILFDASQRARTGQAAMIFNVSVR
ncbi:MAG: hypothetical protein AAGJ94_14870 [Pseudomonadota bacterium]